MFIVYAFGKATLIEIAQTMAMHTRLVLCVLRKETFRLKRIPLKGQMHAIFGVDCGLELGLSSNT